LPIFISQLPN